MFKTTALDIWNYEANLKNIITSSKNLDTVLTKDGLGVIGEVTELCGTPNSGKTQIW